MKDKWRVLVSLALGLILLYMMLNVQGSSALQLAMWGLVAGVLIAFLVRVIRR